MSSRRRHILATAWYACNQTPHVVDGVSIDGRRGFFLFLSFVCLRYELQRRQTIFRKVMLAILLGFEFVLALTFRMLETFLCGPGGDRFKARRPCTHTHNRPPIDKTITLALRPGIGTGNGLIVFFFLIGFGICIVALGEFLIFPKTTVWRLFSGVVRCKMEISSKAKKTTQPALTVALATGQVQKQEVPLMELASSGSACSGR